ncbi:MAG TPA: hypothetical protein VKA06_03450, partial [Spirochaetia bacterium]|nr:hypothetical protein [Spirochaetia bacterium]
MKKAIAFSLMTLLVVSFVTIGAVAQDSGSAIETDEDALFGSEEDMFSDPIIEDVEDAEDAGTTSGTPGTSLLVSEAVEIGGRYSFQVQTSA